MIALFFEKGLYGGGDYFLRIGDAEEIRNQLADLNDWMCLVEMGRTMGPASDQPKLKKLHTFLSTCKDRKTLERFSLKISTGEMRCVMCAETQQEFKEIKKHVLSAPQIETDERAKVSALLDKIDAYFDSSKDASAIIRKFSNMQYITSGIATDHYLD